MATKMGFLLFLGLLGGVAVGTQLPYPASYEAVGGAIIALAIGFFLERKSKD